MKQRKEKLRPWLHALTNPHLLISLAIAWFITNGWAYCAVGIGWYLEQSRLLELGTIWLGILWMPGTPEKLLTFLIAIWLLRVLFPDDTRTLAMLRRKFRAFREHTRLRFRRALARLGGRKRG